MVPHSQEKLLIKGGILQSFYPGAEKSHAGRSICSIRFINPVAGMARLATYAINVLSHHTDIESCHAEFSSA